MPSNPFEEVSSNLRSGLAEKVLSRTGATGIASAIFRNEPDRSSIRFIGSTGIPDESLSSYKVNDLFKQDPFLKFVSLYRNENFRSCRILQRSDLDWESLSGEDYRYFQQFYGINIVCAAILNLRENLFLSVCLHAFHSPNAGLTRDVLPEIGQVVTDVALTLLGCELTSHASQDATRAAGAALGSVRMSSREQHIVELVCDGMMNKQIAYEMGISINAVENNLRRVFKKFDVRNRSSLINRYRNSRYH